MSVLKKIEEARKSLEKKIPSFPRTVIVLGSGLGELLHSVKTEAEIPYSEIPHFHLPSVAGHRGQLIVGSMSGKRVAVLSGRLHFYEGHSMEEVIFPYRVCASAGGEVFILTNAAGGLHRQMVPGEFVLVKDHLSFIGTNPLAGKEVTVLGPHFLDTSNLYDRELRKKALRISKQMGSEIREGVYVALQGPSYETPAEVKMFSMLGGDLAGMSTVPEALAVHHMGKKVVVLSCVTNYCAGVGDTAPNHEEVLENAKKIQVKLSKFLFEFIKEIP